jgi:hypothetical protein
MHADTMAYQKSRRRVFDCKKAVDTTHIGHQSVIIADDKLPEL